MMNKLKSELQMPVWQEERLCRFLRNMVCSIMRTEVVGFSTSVGSSWIFLSVPESTYEGDV